MIKKFRISFFISIISILLLIGTVMAIISMYLNFYLLQDFAVFPLYEGIFFSPLAIVLLFLDFAFNREFEKQYFITSLLLNLLFIIYTLYIWQNFSFNFI